ncbi:hypothetical protein U1Q18_005098 [Sarracenia purpurea var. burkii]
MERTDLLLFDKLSAEVGHPWEEYLWLWGLLWKLWFISWRLAGPVGLGLVFGVVLSWCNPVVWG